MVGVDQAVGKPQQRGLARARAADNGEEFAAFDLKRNVVHRLDAAAVKALGHMRKGDQGCVWHFREYSRVFCGKGRICACACHPSRQGAGRRESRRSLNLSVALAKPSSQASRDFEGQPGGEPKPTEKDAIGRGAENATVAFRLAEGRVYTAVEKANLSVAPGRVRRHRRADRVRQIDIAERGGGPSGAGRGPCADLRWSSLRP